MFDRNSTGFHTNTLRSFLTLKEEIRARDHQFRVIIDITDYPKKSCFISFSFTLFARKSYIFKNSVTNYFTGWIITEGLLMKLWPKISHVGPQLNTADSKGKKTKRC